MQIIGKISGINTSDGMINILVTDGKNNTYNLKTSQEDGRKLFVGDVYEFDIEIKEGERVQYIITSYKNIVDFKFDEKNESLRKFYTAAPLELKELEGEIEKYTGLLTNKVIKAITEYLLKKYHDDYFLYPAATKMHHAYIGGLAYHSISMLKLADGVIAAYPYLNKDYIYAGIMLHDIGKIKELTGIVAPEYSVEGQLIGHLVLGAMEIKEAAKELGFENTKEAMLLEHMLIAHHGMPQFGSAKKPLTAEALVLWYIDSIDSKIRTLEDELAKTEVDSFTQPIGVLDKQKIYKA